VDADVIESWSQWLLLVPELLPLWEPIDLSLGAKKAALKLGLPRGDALERRLRSRGAPPYLTMRNWYYLVQLVRTCQQGLSLSQWALASGRDPAIYYRFVGRTARRSWTEVQRDGPELVMVRAITLWAPSVGTLAGEQESADA